MRILLVEDDVPSAKFLELMLANAGFNVFATHLGEEAVDLVRHYDFDILLLDLGLPDISGHEVIRQLRNMGRHIPVLVLTADEQTETKVRAFTSGADDYLVKPYQREEVVARIQAIVRRSLGHAKAQIKTGDVALNLNSRTVEVAGKIVPLTGSEYAIFELLSLRKGSTLTKEMILNHLYGGIDEPESKIIDVFVCKLRKKIADANNGAHFIETVWGRGYLLRDPGAGAPIVKDQKAA